VQGVFGGSASLLEQATSALGNVAPYHWLDFIANRALYAGIDVGNVTGATGYSFTRASEGYYQNSDGTLTLFGSGALRRGDRGVLIEGSRTNLLLQSQTFDDASWTKSAAGTGSAPVVTANTAAAPDGTMTADTVVFALNGGLTSSDLSQLSQTVAALAGQGTWSVFLKTTDASTKTITLIAPSGDLQKLTVTGSWQRFSVSGSGGTLPRLRLRGDDTVSDSASLHIWGAQLEAASFASSYVPTVAASATRAGDSLSYTAGVSYPVSLWAEFERAVDTGGLETQVQIDDGTGNNRVALTVASTDVANAFSVVGGVAQSSETVAGALAIGTTYKASVRFASNDVRMARGGTLSAGDVSATNPPAPTTIRIGRDTASAEPFGYIRRAAVFNSALTDAQLQTVST
jgi:hypothetical protein